MFAQDLFSYFEPHNQQANVFLIDVFEKRLRNVFMNLRLGKIICICQRVKITRFKVQSRVSSCCLQVYSSGVVRQPSGSGHQARMSVVGGDGLDRPEDGRRRGAPQSKYHLWESARLLQWHKARKNGSVYQIIQYHD